MAPVAEHKELGPGRSYDKLNGRDFLDCNHGKQYVEENREQKPFMLMLSPPCVQYSVMQNCSKRRQEPKARKQRQIEAQVLLDFAMQLCEIQHEPLRV